MSQPAIADREALRGATMDLTPRAETEKERKDRERREEADRRQDEVEVPPQRKGGSGTVTPVGKAGALLASTPRGTGSSTAVPVEAKTVIPQAAVRDQKAVRARS